MAKPMTAKADTEFDTALLACVVLGVTVGPTGVCVDEAVLLAPEPGALLAEKCQRCCAHMRDRGRTIIKTGVRGAALTGCFGIRRIRHW